jgi:hypothetical protein
VERSFPSIRSVPFLRKALKIIVCLLSSLVLGLLRAGPVPQVEIFRLRGHLKENFMVPFFLLLLNRLDDKRPVLFHSYFQWILIAHICRQVRRGIIVYRYIEYQSVCPFVGTGFPHPLLLAIHSHLYSFALRFLFLQTHATSYSFLQFSYCTL